MAEANNNPNSTGVVQSPDTSYSGGIASGTATGSFDYTFSAPVGTKATTLYSLANSAWGTAGYLVGSIVVKGTLGETATLNLVEGVNIRDHNNDGFLNTLSDLTVVTTDFLGGSPTVLSDQTRLDMQTLVLPSTFVGDTIATIDFEGTAYGDNGGSAFLAGLTFSDAAVPDSALPLPLTAGVFLAIFAAAGLRRKQAIRLQSSDLTI